MNRLIGIAGWVDVVDDESICFYTPVALSLLVPSIMIDESKTFNLNYSSIGIFDYLLFLKKKT